MKLAFMTVGILQEPFGHSTVQGFLDRVPSVYAAADASDGFIDRSRRDLETFAQSWGEIVAPKCFGMPEGSKIASTLSFWEDLESVAAFAYHGAHGEAMTKRKEWFEPPPGPEFVAWWVEDDHVIDWTEACERLDHLHDHGPTPYAFNFAMPFDEAGQPSPLKPFRVREKIAANGGEKSSSSH